MSDILKMLHMEGVNLSKIDELKDRKPNDLLLIVRYEDGHTHFVYPEEDTAKDMLYEAIEDKNLDLCVSPAEKPVQLPKRILFHNRQAIGDILMFTCCVRDFKRAFPDIELKVESTAMHLWDYNPNISKNTWNNVLDPLTLKTFDGKPNDAQMLELNKKAVDQAIKEDRPVKLYIGPGRATNASNTSDLHFANAYRISVEAILGVKILQGPIRADIYMSDSEYNKPPIIDPPYWLITAGEKGDWTCKTYTFVNWQKVVESFPETKFVQLGSRGHKHPKLSGDNVIDLIGKTEDPKTGIRDLFNLFNYCEGSLGLVSFQMHLAAAFNKPAVVIAGAREPVWFTRYPGQRYLSTDGCLPCTVNSKGEPVACWYCDIKRCPAKTVVGEQEIPLCAGMITEDDILRAMGQYYIGGRLSLDKPSGKSLLVKRVRDEKPGEKESNAALKEQDAPRLWGFAWGGSSITDRDWEYISKILVDEKIKTVLEFGSGLSTLLMRSMGLDVLSLEESQTEIDRLKKMNPTLNIIRWDKKTDVAGKREFDLAFIDGPFGGQNREVSFVMAKQKAKKIFVHDAARVHERGLIEKHLPPTVFEKVSQGGHRTAFFKRRSPGKSEQPVPADPARKITSHPELIRISGKGGSGSISMGAKRQSMPEPGEAGFASLARAAKKKIHFVFNGRGDGGAERSTTWMMHEFVRRGYDVTYFSPNPKPSGAFIRVGTPGDPVNFSNDLSRIKEPCDLLVLYTNDWVWEFRKLSEVFSDLKARRKVMAVNFRLGSIGSPLSPWTKGWDKYLFLNSTLEEGLKKRLPNIVSRAFAPPADLTEFVEMSPNYSGNIRIVRHSSQGDTKYPKDFGEKIYEILNVLGPSAEIALMPGPSFLSEYPSQVKIHKRNEPSVRDFLSKGNVFWYHLPEGYHDQGPKVIMEAQAVGLPIVADNHSGAKDRVVTGTGFLCDSFYDHIDALRSLQDEKLRKEMGQKAKTHARKQYDPNRWIEEILS